MVNTLYGDRIKTIRKAFGMTQKEFAETVGSTQGTVSSYERNQGNPTMDVLVKIAELGNVTLDWLCGISDEYLETTVIKRYQLYIIYYGEKIVYLGKTTQALDRKLCGHFSKAPLEQQLDAQKITRIEYAEFNNEADMLLYETYFINKLKPEFNITGKVEDLLTITLPPIAFTEYNYRVPQKQ